MLSKSSHVQVCRTIYSYARLVRAMGDESRGSFVEAPSAIHRFNGGVNVAQK